MRIRPEQIACFSAAFCEGFEARAFDYLLASCADNAIVRDEPKLRTLIREGVGRAESYGIIREIDVIRFLELLLTIGPNFDLSETFRSCLRHEGSAEERLDMILERARFADLTTS